MATFHDLRAVSRCVATHPGPVRAVRITGGRASSARTAATLRQGASSTRGDLQQGRAGRGVGDLAGGAGRCSGHEAGRGAGDLAGGAGRRSGHGAGRGGDRVWD
jgi:hypothetical protein